MREAEHSCVFSQSEFFIFSEDVPRELFAVSVINDSARSEYGNMAQTIILAPIWIFFSFCDLKISDFDDKRHERQTEKDGQKSNAALGNRADKPAFKLMGVKFRQIAWIKKNFIGLYLASPVRETSVSVEYLFYFPI